MSALINYRLGRISNPPQAASLADPTVAGLSRRGLLLSLVSGGWAQHVPTFSADVKVVSVLATVHDRDGRSSECGSNHQAVPPYSTFCLSRLPADRYLYASHRSTRHTSESGFRRAAGHETRVSLNWSSSTSWQTTPSGTRLPAIQSDIPPRWCSMASSIKPSSAPISRSRPLTPSRASFLASGRTKTGGPWISRAAITAQTICFVRL